MRGSESGSGIVELSFTSRDSAGLPQAGGLCQPAQKIFQIAHPMLCNYLCIVSVFHLDCTGQLRLSFVDQRSENPNALSISCNQYLISENERMNTAYSKSRIKKVSAQDLWFEQKRWAIDSTQLC